MQHKGKHKRAWTSGAPDRLGTGNDLYPNANRPDLAFRRLSAKSFAPVHDRLGDMQVEPSALLFLNPYAEDSESAPTGPAARQVSR